MYSYDSYQSDPEAGEQSTRIKIDKLGLIEKQNFVVHYDFEGGLKDCLVGAEEYNKLMLK